jgi:L-fuconolactonase
MPIDAHQHFWIYDPGEYEWIDESMASLRRDFLPADLEPHLKQAGVRGTVAVQARQSLEETRWLLGLAEESESILGVVGWVDLQSGDVGSQLAEFAGKSKFVGVRHIIQSEPDDRFLLRPAFLRGIAALEAFDLAYDILIYERHLPVAAEFVRMFPRQRFVLDHMAKPPIRAGSIKSGSIDSWLRGIQDLAASSNVFCKLSGLVTEADWVNWKPEEITPYLDVVFQAFGPDRLMMGSDWPVCLVAAPYERTLKLATDYLAEYSPEAQAAITGGNAQRFWRLKV